jgi:hypothetical protein
MFENNSVLFRVEIPDFKTEYLYLPRSAGFTILRLKNIAFVTRYKKLASLVVSSGCVR